MMHWIWYHHWPRWAGWTHIMWLPWPATGSLQGNTCMTCKRQKLRHR